MQIIEISEKYKDNAYLLDCTGYCIIDLIAHLIGPPPSPYREEDVVSHVFFEYDSIPGSSRLPDECYIRAAHEYLERREKR